MLLSVSPKDKQKILYEDGISVKYDKETATVSKDDITFAIPASNLQTTLAEELKAQKGDYPPAAANKKVAEERTLADTQMLNAIAVKNYKKAKAAKQAAKAAEQTKSAPKEQNNIAMLKANQQKTM